MRPALAATLFAAIWMQPIAAFTQTTLAKYQTVPRLTVVVVVDQLRAHLLDQLSARFQLAKRGRRGLRWLMSQSAYFPRANFNVMQPMTCPGHATIATGAYPARTGIALNAWWDPGAQREIYCVEDGASQRVEQRSARARGRGPSPRKLQGQTIGDVLKLSHETARVVSVSIKDRSAIMLGGYAADGVYWYDYRHAGRWVSSTFYLPTGELPPWVGRINGQLRDVATEPTQWTVAPRHPAKPGSPRPAAKVYSHRKGERAAALSSAYGLQITTNMALEAAFAHRLGTDAVPDLLFISYATTDTVGHRYGPHSDEFAQILVDIDRELIRLFGALQRLVGRDPHALAVVLTSDHGVADTAAVATGHRIPATPHSPTALAREIDRLLNEQFGAVHRQTSWVAHATLGNVWLNPRALEERGVAQRDAEHYLQRALANYPDIDTVVSKRALLAGHWPAGRLGTRVKNGFHPRVNGDLVVIYRPYVLPDAKLTTNHLSPHAYDRLIPLLIYGANVRPGVYAATAELRDIAPTVAFMLGILPPPQSEGRVLAEIFAPSD